MSGRDVRSLLYDGERVEHDLDVGSGRVVVTSHRVLAFSTAAGANYRHVDRPNVEGVGVVTESARQHVLYAVSFVILAAPIWYASTILSFDGMFAGLNASEGGRAIGVGGVGGLVGSLGFVFGLIDDGLFWTAVLFVLAAVGSLAYYLYSRTRILRVEVAGDADLRIDVDGADGVDAAVQQLERALGFGGAGTANTAAGGEAGGMPGADPNPGAGANAGTGTGSGAGPNAGTGFGSDPAETDRDRN